MMGMHAPVEHGRRRCHNGHFVPPAVLWLAIHYGPLRSGLVVGDVLTRRFFRRWGLFPQRFGLTE